MCLFDKYLLKKIEIETFILIFLWFLARATVGTSLYVSLSQLDS